MKRSKMILNWAVLLTALFFLASCGQPDNQCKNKDSMILQCRAEELSKIHYPTQWQMQMIKERCERLYQVNRCY